MSKTAQQQTSHQENCTRHDWDRAAGCLVSMSEECIHVCMHVRGVYVRIHTATPAGRPLPAALPHRELRDHTSVANFIALAMSSTADAALRCDAHSACPNVHCHARGGQLFRCCSGAPPRVWQVCRACTTLPWPPPAVQLSVSLAGSCGLHDAAGPATAGSRHHVPSASPMAWPRYLCATWRRSRCLSASPGTAQTSSATGAGRTSSRPAT